MVTSLLAVAVAVGGASGSGDPDGGNPVGGDDARRAAQRELSRPEYAHHHGPGVLERVAQWIARHLGDLFGHVGQASGGGNVVLLVLLAVLVGAVLLGARAGLPGRRRLRRVEDEADLLAGSDPVDHRRLAQEYTDNGRHAEALREWLRAAVATIEQRGILPTLPGRTGAATARAAGPVLPTVAEDLRAATAAFDEVWFGGRTATPADVAVAHAAADGVRDARPRRTTDAFADAGLAVPW